MQSPRRWFFLELTFLKFLVTGVLNTFVGLGTIFLLKWLFGFGDTLANACGYGIGIAFSCAVNSRWTFESRESLLSIAPKYVLLVGAAYLVNLLVVHLALASGIDSYVAQSMGVPPYTLITYFGAKFWIFRAPARS
jgi:putative flippase GtrA